MNKHIRAGSLSVASLGLVLFGAAAPAIAGPEDPGPGTPTTTTTTTVLTPETVATGSQDEVSLLTSEGVDSNEAAAIAADDALVAAMTAAPSCVSARYSNPFGPYQDVTVTNNCAISQRVKVIWAFAYDSACHSIAAGSSWKDHHFDQTTLDRWDGIKSC